MDENEELVETQKTESKVSIYAAIIAVSISIGGALFSAAGWIDSRYVHRDEMSIIAYTSVVITYNQRISTMNDILEVMLEHRAEETELIKAVRISINDLKHQRANFLRDGHIEIGDSIMLNRTILEDKLGHARTTLNK